MLQLLLMVLILGAGLLFGANWSGAPRFAAALAGVVMIVLGIGLALPRHSRSRRVAQPAARPTDKAVLISDGIYRRLRHPIYAGIMLLGLGWALLTASVVALALALLLAVVLDLKARREEAWLTERFAAYPTYAARTRRFVPGVY